MDDPEQDGPTRYRREDNGKIEESGDLHSLINKTEIMPQEEEDPQLESTLSIGGTGVMRTTKPM
jgi:hypothetical protein